MSSQSIWFMCSHRAVQWSAATSLLTLHKTSGAQVFELEIKHVSPGTVAVFFKEKVNVSRLCCVLLPQPCLLSSETIVCRCTGVERVQQTSMLFVRH